MGGIVSRCLSGRYPGQGGGCFSLQPANPLKGLWPAESTSSGLTTCGGKGLAVLLSGCHAPGKGQTLALPSPIAGMQDCQSSGGLCFTPCVLVGEEKRKRLMLIKKSFR